jgi:hypothetical protein
MRKLATPSACPCSVRAQLKVKQNLQQDCTNA